MLNKRCFDFGSGQTVTADVDNVVDAASDPVVAFVVAPSAVSGKLLTLAPPSREGYLNAHVVALVHIQIRVHVPLVCAPNRAGHAGPWLFESKHAFNVVSVDFLTRHRVDDGGFDAKEGQRCRSGLGRSNAAQWCNDV